MMEYVIPLAIALIVMAIIGLFAMMGELTSKVDSLESLVQPQTSRDGDQEEWLQHWPAKAKGQSPDSWPAELAHLPRQASALLVILSCACQTCSTFARGSLSRLETLPCNVGFLISCPHPDAVGDFLRRHEALTTYPLATDMRGDWSRSQLDIDTSPSAVIFMQGAVTDVYTTSSPSSLASVVRQSLEAEEGVES